MSDDEPIIIRAPDLVNMIAHLTNAVTDLATATAELARGQNASASIATERAGTRVDAIITIMEKLAGGKVTDGD